MPSPQGSPKAKRARGDEVFGYNSTWKEGGYTGLKEGDDIKTWGQKHTDITDEHVYIDGHPVMEAWEQPYMARLAKEATLKGGKVLEVGFGMALSASAVQKFDIKEHVIIEASEEVFKRLEEWAKKQPHKVTPMLGLWQDVVKTLKDDDFDGILYDTFPNNKEHQHTHQFEFISEARRILKPGGVMTYCNLTSLGMLRPTFEKPGRSDLDSWKNLFEETQRPHLLKCGFAPHEIKEIGVFSGLTPPKSCAYYQHSSMLVPHIQKAGYNSTWKEGGYTGLKEGDDIKTWGQKHTDITDEHVYIDGHPVMEAWEQPYMARLAKEATLKGGKVLEVGFGMALSASAVQKFDIKEHVIIEASEEVFKRLEEWAKKQPHKVTPMLGLWQDVVKTLPDADFDGILYDTFPNNKEHQHTHQFEFIGEARRILKPGGVLTYCNLTSLGVLRPTFEKEGRKDLDSWKALFEETQRPHLLKCGFTADEIKEIAIYSGLTPPKTCAYYQHSSMLVPHIEKKA